MSEQLLAVDSKEQSKNFRYPPFRGHNHNVVLNLLTKSLFGLADGIWNGTVLASYLFHIGGNQYAGYAEAAMGISTLVVALPAGYAADRGSKSLVCSIGGLVTPCVSRSRSSGLLPSMLPTLPALREFDGSKPRSAEWQSRCHASPSCMLISIRLQRRSRLCSSSSHWPCGVACSPL